MPIELVDESEFELEQEASTEPSASSEEMSDDDILSFVEQQISNSLGEYSDEQAGNFEQAMLYFRCSPRGDEIEGRSQVVSPDLQDAIEAILAEIMPAFSGDMIGVFPPRDAQDEKAAAQESKLVNHIFMEESCGYLKLLEGFKSAMLQRTGYLKVMWEEMIEVSYETLAGVPVMGLAAALQPKQPGEEVEIISTEQSEDAQLYDLKLRRKRPVGNLSVVSIPPEDMRVLSSYTSQTLRDCPFVAHICRRTKSELVALGYPKETVMDLSPVTDDTDVASDARNRNSDEMRNNAPAWQNDDVYVVDAYCLIDVDGDGIAERRRVVSAGGNSKETAGTVVLEKEPFWGVPIASLIPFLFPHRHQGMSLFDKLEQVQDIKTAFLRQTIDNGYIVNNSRLVVQEGMVNLNDALTSVPGGIVRARNINSVKPLPTASTGDVGIKMLEYMDKIRRETGGASLDAAANGVQVPRDSSHAAERLFGNLEKLSALIARTFAETGVSELYTIIHRTLVEYAPGEITRKVKKEWISTQPSQWQPRPRAAVTIGLTQGERFAQVQAINGLLEIALRIQENPNLATLISPVQIYNMLTDLVRASGLDDPEQYWVDPTSQQGQQAQQAQAQQARQAQQAQQAQVEQQSKLMLALQQMQEETDRIKAQMDAQQKTADRQFKYDELFEDVRTRLLELETQYKENVSPTKTSAG